MEQFQFPAHNYSFTFLDISGHLEQFDVQLQKGIRGNASILNGIWFYKLHTIKYLNNPGYKVNSSRKYIFLLSSWSCSFIYSCNGFVDWKMLNSSFLTFDRNVLFLSELKNLVITKRNNTKECTSNYINTQPKWVWQRQLDNISTTKVKGRSVPVKYK